MSLGPTQKRVLHALHHHLDEAPPTAREIADWLYGNDSYRRPTSEMEAISNCLSRLCRKGLVERLGKSSTNAWCWRITGTGESERAST